MSRDVVVLSAVRSAIGAFNGSLSSLEPSELGGIVMKEAVARSGVDPALINYITVGNTIPTDNRYAYVARVASIQAGLPMESVAMGLNRLCSSGLQAIVTTAQAIMLGDCDYGIGGGVEVMSRGMYGSPAMRSGARMGDAKMIDLMVSVLTDPFGVGHMGVTAENLVEKWKLTREEQDAFAVQSYERSAKAWAEGKFDNEVIPVSIPQRRGEPIIFAKDEEFTNVKLDKIPTLNAVFTKDGTVTAANASTINDGAAALVLMSEEKAQSLGLKPLAYIKSYADAAQEPKWFTTAPAKALPKALNKAGISISDVDYFEFNEAFSVVGLANAKILGLDNNKVNVNGGAVSLGHPLGCSGARIIVTLINVLEQNNAKIGAAAICNGGGGASAIVIERA
jgi:acetyl-CoA C-acetyltransferase